VRPTAALAGCLLVLADTERAVRAIAGDYKARFKQESVLRVRSLACSSF
jgi:hypothetical protein